MAVNNYPCEMSENDLIVKVAKKIDNSKESGISFNLSFKQVQQIFSKQKACAYSGLLFTGVGDVSFERINPRMPYNNGNVVLVKKDINTLKGETIDRFIHESGLTLDAMADMFSLVGKKLREEYNSLQPKPEVSFDDQVRNETQEELKERLENMSAADLLRNTPAGIIALTKLQAGAKSHKEARQQQFNNPRHKGKRKSVRR